MALDYNPVQAPVDVQAPNVVGESKARSTDHNVLSMVALLSDSVSEAKDKGKKKLYSSAPASSSNAAASNSTTGGTSFKQGMIELAQLLSDVMSELIKTSEAMQSVTNDIDQAAIDNAQSNLDQTNAAIKKNEEAEKQQQEAKTWGIFAAIGAAILGVAITILTGGSATAIAVAAVIGVATTVLTATGALQDLTSCIETALENDGMPKAVAQVLASIITIVVVVVATVLGSAGVSAAVDAATNSLVGGATEVASEVGESVSDAIADDVGEDVAEDVTSSLKKGLVKALAKLSTTTLKDASEIENVVSEQVDEAVSSLGDDVSEDAVNSMKKEITETLKDAFANNTKPQVLNGIKGMNAVAYGAAKGAVASIGLASSSLTDLTGGILEAVYGDSDKAPDWIEDVVAACAAIGSILATLYGEGALGNVGGAAKGALEGVGDKITAWIENNSVNIARVQSIVGGLVQAAGASASVVGGVAANNQGQAQKDLADYQSVETLMQYIMNTTNDNISSDKDALNQAMNKMTTEINNVINSMGQESDAIANALRAS